MSTLWTPVGVAAAGTPPRCIPQTALFFRGYRWHPFGMRPAPSRLGQALFVPRIFSDKPLEKRRKKGDYKVPSRRSSCRKAHMIRLLRGVFVVSLVLLILCGDDASTQETGAPQFVSFQAPAPVGVWPSLEEQLAQSNVTPGSALDKLIRANQDFSILDPDEASDGWGLPPWLRVHWRKAHHNGRLAAEAASAGFSYPRALKNVYRWMITHQDLKPGNPSGGGAPGGGGATRVATAGPNVRISGASAVPKSESDIRVNYLNPSKIIAASNTISAGGSQSQFFSSDGGATWSQTNLPLQPGDAFHSDPTVDWTSDGTAWSTTLGINALGTVLQLRSYRSSDGGATWVFDATASGAQNQVDKQLIWVDRGPASPFKDNLYAIWHNGAPVFVNRRTG